MNKDYDYTGFLEATLNALRSIPEDECSSEVNETINVAIHDLIAILKWLRGASQQQQTKEIYKGKWTRAPFGGFGFGVWRTDDVTDIWWTVAIGPFTFHKKHSKQLVHLGIPTGKEDE